MTCEAPTLTVGGRWRARGQPRAGSASEHRRAGRAVRHRPAERGLTAVAGLKVGHHTLDARPTGCTVVIAEAGAVGGVDVRGGAPGTRDTELLNPVNTVSEVHAIVLSGGSAFGLAAADGVMKYLDEKHIGFRTSGGVVPIVPAAILFDLAVGDATHSSRRRLRIRRGAGGRRRTGRGRQRRRRRGRDGRQAAGIDARDERRTRELGDSTSRRPGRRRARRGQRGRQRDRSGNRALHCRRADRRRREHRGPARVAAERAGGRAAGPWKTRRSASWPPTRR